MRVFIVELRLSFKWDNETTDCWNVIIDAQLHITLSGSMVCPLPVFSLFHNEPEWKRWGRKLVGS